MVFITGWNEWIAGNWESDMWMEDMRHRYLAEDYEGVTFVDNFDINNSRDIEPMKDGYGDNYFMQMVDFIRRYKGTDARVNVGSNTTVDIQGAWSQWDSVTAVYRDQTGETGARDTGVYGQYSLVDANNYISAAASNDIATMKVTRDSENFYFYVDCVGDITVTNDSHMVLFIKSGLEATSSWKGYDYLFESHSSSLKRCGRDGIWEAVSSVELRLEGNQLMLKIPAASLGYTSTDLVDLQFKWADSWISDNGLWSFYTDGECAPYGRFNYVFSNRK